MTTARAGVGNQDTKDRKPNSVIAFPPTPDPSLLFSIL
jgi:hypothetical protein